MSVATTRPVAEELRDVSGPSGHRVVEHQRYRLLVLVADEAVQIAPPSLHRFADPELKSLPSGTSLWLPVHAVGIVHMGLLIGEIFDLEALADDCERDGTYEFFFSAPPLPFTGAVGSPINPLAIK